MERIISCLLIIWIFCSPCSGKLRQKVFNFPCSLNQFRCQNDVCISKRQFCNSVDDCGDNSDEKYCSDRSTCPSDYPFYKCPNSNRCIPAVWRCDGTAECLRYYNNNDDEEKNCENVDTLSVRVAFARKKAKQWIYNQAQNRSSTDRWGPHVQKTAVALFLADPGFASPNTTRREMAYELSIQLLSKFTLRKIKEVITADIASYINALLVTCIDPRTFHSVDLVKELRHRVNAQNYSNPYDLLVLCNAGDKITKKDWDKLNHAFWSDRRESWTQTQAIVVMAFVCAQNQPGSRFSQETFKEYTEALKQKQSRNGTVENLQTTALVMQALFASEPEEDENSFDEEKAFLQILREQGEDGSFGSIVDTYYILPLLNFRSLVNISSGHCKPYIKDENTALQDLMNTPGSKIRVRYTLWIGDQKDVERTLKLRVPSNSSFYGVMEVAGDIDSQYRFQYVVKDTKPYVTVLSGIPDDPETGRFWFPYFYNDTKPYPLNASPAEIILKDNDHVAMWYQSGSWIE